MSLGRDALANKASFKRATVEVPELGGMVLVRELSAAEATRVQGIAMGAVDQDTKKLRDVSALLQFQAQVIIAGWIDDDGNNVLTQADTDMILAQPAAVVERIAEAITKLSGMTGKTPEAPLEAAKNG